MSEGIARTSSASEFQATVVEGSRRKPVLVEMGSTEWCPDCTTLEDTGVLGRIAKRGRVAVVQHETPRSTVTEAWATDNPDEARQHGITPQANPSNEARLLSRAGLNVTNYPTVFLFDNGQSVPYYREGRGPTKDRAVDSDLVERDPQTNERRPRQTGINALERSVGRYRRQS